MVRPALIRDLPQRFSHYFTVANDTDSESFETAQRVRQGIRDEFGLDLSDSFFPNTEWDPTFSALIGLRGREAEPDGAPVAAFIRDGVRDGWLDHVHGLTSYISVAEWPPMVMGRGSSPRRFELLGYGGAARPVARVIGFRYRRRGAPPTLRIVDLVGRDHWIVPRGELGSRPGWEVDYSVASSGSVILECAAERNAERPCPGFDTVEVQGGGSVVITCFFYSNAGRPVFRAILQALERRNLRVAIMTSHGQVDHIGAVGLAPHAWNSLWHAVRARRWSIAWDDARRGLGTWRGIILGRISRAGQLLRKTREISGIGAALRVVLASRQLATRFPGDDPCSPFYCTDLLAEHGIEFVRLYSETSRVHFVRLRHVIRPIRLGGHRFYAFRGLHPRAPELTSIDATNPDLHRQLAEVQRCLASQPEFHGGVLYTHWGCYPGQQGPPAEVFDAATRHQLGELATASRSWLWVAPVSVVLRRAQVLRGLERNCQVQRGGDVEIRSWRDPITGEAFNGADALDGLGGFAFSAARGARRVVWDEREIRGSRLDDGYVVFGEAARR